MLGKDTGRFRETGEMDRISASGTGECLGGTVGSCLSRAVEGRRNGCTERQNKLGGQRKHGWVVGRERKNKVERYALTRSKGGIALGGCSDEGAIVGYAEGDVAYG